MERRTLLKRVGIAAGTIAVAGCAGPGDDGADNDTDENNDTGLDEDGAVGEGNDTGLDEENDTA